MAGHHAGMRSSCILFPTNFRFTSSSLPVRIYAQDLKIFCLIKGFLVIENLELRRRKMSPKKETTDVGRPILYWSTYSVKTILGKV